MRLNSYLSNRNELTPRKGFVIMQATPHRFFWVRSWSFLKKYNNVPSLHMYIFIIKAAKPAIFLRFAHIYVLVPNMYNGSKVCVFYSQSGSENPPACDILNKS